MLGLQGLADALKSLLEALAWFMAFCFLAVMPVSPQHKLLLILGWFIAAFIQLYREVRRV